MDTVLADVVLNPLRDGLCLPFSLRATNTLHGGPQARRTPQNIPGAPVASHCTDRLADAALGPGRGAFE